MKENKKNLYMLEHKKLRKRGYDWWWHSFTGYNRKTGEEKTFFIEYFIINPASGGETPVLGQLVENKNKGIKPSYCLIKVGTWGKNKKQIHNFYGINALKYEKDFFKVTIGENLVSNNRLVGSVKVSEEEAEKHPEFMCNAGYMKWDLKLFKKLSYDVGFGASSLARKLNAFEMYWHAEGMKTDFEGIVELDGDIYDVILNKSYGYQDKNWGGNYTSPWIWLNCNNLRNKGNDIVLENTSLDIGGGCPVVFGKQMEGKILTMFYYEGKGYEYNFSKFWTGVKQEYKFYEYDEEVRWVITSINRNSKLEVDFKCKKDDMLLVNYENPDGEKKHNYLLNGGTASGIVKLYEKKENKFILIVELEGKNGGCEYGEYDKVSYR